jgi:hypothetical protein
MTFLIMGASIAVVLLAVVAERPATTLITTSPSAIAVETATSSLLSSLGGAVLAILTGGGIGRWMGCRLVV